MVLLPEKVKPAGKMKEGLHAVLAIQLQPVLEGILLPESWKQSDEPSYHCADFPLAGSCSLLTSKRCYLRATVPQNHLALDPPNTQASLTAQALSPVPGGNLNSPRETLPLPAAPRPGRRQIAFP